MPADKERNENMPKMYRGIRLVWTYDNFSASVGQLGSTKGGSSMGQYVRRIQ